MTSSNGTAALVARLVRDQRAYRRKQEELEVLRVRRNETMRECLAAGLRRMMILRVLDESGEHLSKQRVNQIVRGVD